MTLKKDPQSLSNTGEIYSNVTQTSANFSKNIVTDSHVSTSLIKVVYSPNETVTTASQAIGTNVSMIKNNNEINVLNDGMKLFNVNNDIKIIRNIHNSSMGTSLNNNIISFIPSTSNRLINLDENKFGNCINLDELSS